MCAFIGKARRPKIDLHSFEFESCPFTIILLVFGTFSTWSRSACHHQTSMCGLSRTQEDSKSILPDYRAPDIGYMVFNDRNGVIHQKMIGVLTGLIASHPHRRNRHTPLFDVYSPGGHACAWDQGVGGWSVFRVGRQQSGRCLHLSEHTLWFDVVMTFCSCSVLG